MSDERLCANSDCNNVATREYCYPAEPWIPYCPQEREKELRAIAAEMIAAEFDSDPERNQIEVDRALCKWAERLSVLASSVSAPQKGS
jgi:hypothetical protein